MEKEHKENMLIAANYLEDVDPDVFEMKYFYHNRNQHEAFLRASDTLNAPSCGTAACALGHCAFVSHPNFKEAVEASLEEKNYGIVVNFTKLGWMLFGIVDSFKDENRWAWCFHPDWHSIDNTPKGAARRMKILLKNYGVPPKEFCNYRLSGEKLWSLEFKETYEKILKTYEEIGS